MFNLQAKVYSEKYSISIGKVKFLYGSDNEKKSGLFSVIRKHFNNIENSEYAVENNKESFLLINDKEIQSRKWKMYSISDKVDLLNEFKLSAKALITKYFETILRDIEYEELVNTINALFKDLGVIIEDKMDNLNLDFRVSPEFDEITAKQIIKMISIDLYKEECKASIYDLGIEKILLMEMRMIKEICSKNQLLNYLVLVDVRKITDDLYREMAKDEYKNLHFLVILDHPLNVEIQDVANFGEKNLDFANDVDIYNEIIMESQSVYTLDEMKVVIKNYVMGEQTDKVNQLTDIIK